METEIDYTKKISWPVSGGELGDLVRAKDWSETPLGPITKWPQNLKTAVDICLNSKFPSLVFWGKDLIQIYNDGARIIYGDNHPKALGEKVSVTWPEVWTQIGPLMNEVLNQSQAFWLEDTPFFLKRHGYTEEAYFTFSYSPIHNDDGKAVGVFQSVIEVTDTLLAQRRMAALYDLGNIGAPLNYASAMTAIGDILSRHKLDIPCSFIYSLNEANDPTQTKLTSSSGFEEHPVILKNSFPLAIDTEKDDPWNFSEVLTTKAFTVIDNLTHLKAALPGGSWPEPTNTVMTFPLTQMGSLKILGFLVIGISPRRALDQSYKDFLGFVSQSISRILSMALLNEQHHIRETLKRM